RDGKPGPLGADAARGVRQGTVSALFFAKEVVMTHNRNKSVTYWTLAITSLALFMVSLDNLVVTTALPVIRRDLHATISQLEWTVNAYTLTFAVLLLTGAALGDRFGRHRRPRGRARAARRRRDRQRRFVALDLLGERPDRARARAARVLAPRGVARRRSRSRPARARARQHRAPGDRVGARARKRPRLDERRHRRSHRRRSTARRRVRRMGAARVLPDAPDAVLPRSDVHAHERRVAL